MPVTPAPPTSREFSFPTPGSALNTPSAASPVAFTGGAKENAGAQRTTTLPVAGQITHQPIDSLNPYRAKWTIRAKVDRKQEKKSSLIKGEQTSILTVVLVDQAVRPCPLLAPFACWPYCSSAIVYLCSRNAAC